MKEKMINDLEKLCCDIYAHSKLDYEITLAGNGTNPCEASNVASEIENICGFKITQEDIKKRIEILELEYGE